MAQQRLSQSGPRTLPLSVRCRPGKHSDCHSGKSGSWHLGRQFDWLDLGHQPFSKLAYRRCRTLAALLCNCRRIPYQLSISALSQPSALFAYQQLGLLCAARFWRCTLRETNHVSTWDFVDWAVHLSIRASRAFLLVSSDYRDLGKTTHHLSMDWRTLRMQKVLADSFEMLPPCTRYEWRASKPRHMICKKFCSLMFSVPQLYRVGQPNSLSKLGYQSSVHSIV